MEQEQVRPNKVSSSKGAKRAHDARSEERTVASTVANTVASSAGKSRRAHLTHGQPLPLALVGRRHGQPALELIQPVALHVLGDNDEGALLGVQGVETVEEGDCLDGLRQEHREEGGCSASKRGREGLAKRQLLGWAGMWLHVGSHMPGAGSLQACG